MHENWPQLVAHVRGCRSCHENELAQPDSRPLFQRDPPQNADVLFVLEAPNWTDTFDEDKGYLTYDCDTDPSGVFFRKLFTEELAEPINTVAVTNAALCLPKRKKGGHPVPAAMLQACAGHLQAQIDVLTPLIVAPVGAIALDATRRLGNHGLRKLGEAVGKEVAWLGRILFPLAHPSVRGRISRKDRDQRKDWRKLRVVLDRERRLGRQATRVQKSAPPFDRADSVG